MKTGDVFSMILEQPIEMEGWVIAGQGAKVDARVAESDSGGRLKGKANLAVELTALTLKDGRKIELVTNALNKEANDNKGKDAAKIGIGAGAGAGIGAIAGGGKGAAIGAAIGGVAGLAMKGDAADIPAETVMTFELRSPVTVTERLKR